MQFLPCSPCTGTAGSGVLHAASDAYAKLSCEGRLFRFSACGNASTHAPDCLLWPCGAGGFRFRGSPASSRYSAPQARVSSDGSVSVFALAPKPETLISSVVRPQVWCLSSRRSRQCAAGAAPADVYPKNEFEVFGLTIESGWAAPGVCARARLNLSAKALHHDMGPPSVV